MKTNSVKVRVAALTLMVAGTAFGSGFALYEPTTVSHAMGGALVGKAMDASANYNNPATLTDLTNIQVTVGFVTEHPRCNVDTRQNGGSWKNEQMDPGLFWLPHMQLAVPLPCDFAFGLGISAEYGLGSQYSDNWMMNFSSVDTTIQGIVINPNLAYKITDKWSVGAGLRWLFFDFEQYSMPQAQGLGTFSNRLYGKNNFKSFGWQIGTKYDILDNLSVGLVYKSAIDVAVRGKVETDVYSYNDAAISQYAASQASAAVASAVQTTLAGYGFTKDTPGYSQVYQAAYTKAYQAALPTATQKVYDTLDASAASHNGAAEADITLPQSISGGINWDVFPTWHLGAALTWTEWSCMDGIHFRLAGGDKTTQLDWRDTWRASIGSCWDFAQDWKWMVSYTYDMDAVQSTQASTMIPPADRHILATGFAWNCWAGLELSISYACIFMDGGDLHMSDSLGNSYDFGTNWGFCHAVGASVTYRF